MAANVNNFETEDSNHGKLSGVHFDNKVTFDHYISEMCKIASWMIYALVRVAKYFIYEFI